MKKYEELDEQEYASGTEVSIDLLPFFRRLFKNWKRILIWALCGAAFGIVVGISTPRSYTSTAVVAPEIATRSTMGNGLSSLASLAGVNVNTLALTDAMHPDLYPEVIKSTNFKIGLFDMPVTVATRDSLVHTDLYDYLVNYNKAPWWGYVLNLPRLALNGIKSVFSRRDDLDEVEGHAHVDSLRLTRQQEMVVKMLSSRIEASVEKKTFVLSLKVTMQDPVIAAQLANTIIDRLRQFVTTYRTEKARENVEYFEKLYEETRESYHAAQKALAYYSDSNLGVSTNISRVRLQQLQNEAQLQYQMYNQTAQNLLAARAKLQQEAPVLVIIQPGLAPHRGKPSKAKLAIVWFVVGAIAGIVATSFRRKDTEQE